MRIIVINDHASVNGGAAQVAISSLNKLAEKGLDVIFFSAVTPISPQINASMVHVINVGLKDLSHKNSFLEAALRGIWDSRCSKKLSLVLDECSPADTIIHLHTWTKAISSSVVREAYKRGFKVVCTLHDYFTICPNGGLYNYNSRTHCHLNPMSFQCWLTNCDSRSYIHKIWRNIRQIVQNKFGLMPRAINNYISISDFSEKFFIDFLPMHVKFYRVRNPVDIKPNQRANPAASNYFVYVGRLSPEKGARLFAKAAMIAGVNAVFVGTGIDEDKIRIENPRAKILGWLGRDDVADVISNSRALVFPSLWYETQGLVVYEAAALGVPSIVSDCCAARDGIIDNVTGLLFKNGCEIDLADKLRFLKNSDAKVRELGSSSYDFYWKNPPSIEQHVDQLIDCYKKILY